MTNSNLRTENHFDYVKISIASPQRIMDWDKGHYPMDKSLVKLQNLKLSTTEL